MRLVHFSNIEGFDELYINAIFLSIFTVEELEGFMKYAFAVDENNIIINTKNYLFELMIVDNNVLIRSNKNNGVNSSSNTISKKTFLIMLSQSEIQFPKQLEINE